MSSTVHQSVSSSDSVKDRVVEAFSDPKVVCAFVIVVCILGWVIYTFVIKKKTPAKTVQEPPVVTQEDDSTDEDTTSEQEEETGDVQPVVENAE